MKFWIGLKWFHLTPSQWFVEGHDLRFTNSTSHSRPCTCEASTCVWSPPPYTGDVAIEQIRHARLKRQEHLHLFIILKLFYSLWRRQLFKCMDLVLFLPPQFNFWPSCMHEPLIIAFLYPFVRSEPWSVKGTPKLCSVSKKLQSMWKTDKVDGRNILCKLLLEGRKFPSFPERLVRPMSYFD